MLQPIPLHPGRQLFNAEFGDQIELRTSSDPNEDQVFLHVWDADDNVCADVKLDPDTAHKLGLKLAEAAYTNAEQMQS